MNTLKTVKDGGNVLMKKQTRMTTENYEYQLEEMHQAHILEQVEQARMAKSAQGEHPHPPSILSRMAKAARNFQHLLMGLIH